MYVFILKPNITDLLITDYWFTDYWLLITDLTEYYWFEVWFDAFWTETETFSARHLSRLSVQGCWLNPGDVITNLNPSPSQLGSLGERCKLPSKVWDGAPAAIDFDAFLIKKKAFSAISFTIFYS